MNNSRNQGPNTKPIVRMLVLSWLIIGVGVWWVFFSGSAEQQDNTTIPLDDQPVDDIQRWYIGEKVLFDGELIPEEGFGRYTHTFVNEQGKEFGAKSSIYDLSEFNWTVQLKWEINDFEKDIPVISVEEIIKKKDSASTDTAQIDKNPNYYYDMDNWLGLDLSISDWFEIQEENWELSLIDQKSEWTEPVLTIAPFACKSGDSLQDCAALKQRFEDFGNDTFTNGQDVTFYNLTETNTWFAFNKENYGFTFRSPSSDMITTFGALVNFIDEERLDAYVVANKDLCKNITSSLGTIEKIAYQDQGEWVLSATIIGKNNVGWEASCKMLIRLWSTLESVFAGYKVDGEEEVVEEELTLEEEKEEPVEEEIIEENQEEDLEEEIVEENEEVVEEEKASITPPAGDVSKPVSFDGWLQYASIRGFTMWFSKKGVAYVGNVFDWSKDLGIEGLQCWYKVNVIEWKRADDVSANPDLEVYECYGAKVTAAQAQAQWLKLVWASWNNQYLVKYYTNNLDGMTIYVEEGWNSNDDNS